MQSDLKGKSVHTSRVCVAETTTQSMGLVEVLFNGSCASWSKLLPCQRSQFQPCRSKTCTQDAQVQGEVTVTGLSRLEPMRLPPFTRVESLQAHDSPSNPHRTHEPRGSTPGSLLDEHTRLFIARIFHLYRFLGKAFSINRISGFKRTPVFLFSLHNISALILFFARVLLVSPSSTQGCFDTTHDFSGRSGNLQRKNKNIKLAI